MKIMKFSWWRLFNQAIYIYLISCRVKLNCQIELLSQAFQLNLSSWIQLLNSTRHFFKKISTQLNTFQVEYLTWRDQSINIDIINAHNNHLFVIIFNDSMMNIRLSLFLFLHHDCKSLVWMHSWNTSNYQSYVSFSCMISM